MRITARKGWKGRLALVMTGFASYGGMVWLAHIFGAPLEVAWIAGLFFLWLAGVVLFLIGLLIQYVVDGL